MSWMPIQRMWLRYVQQIQHSAGPTSEVLSASSSSEERSLSIPVAINLPTPEELKDLIWLASIRNEIEFVLTRREYGHDTVVLRTRQAASQMGMVAGTRNCDGDIGNDRVIYYSLRNHWYR